MSGVSHGHIIAAMLIIQFQSVLSAIRWRFTAGRLGQDISMSLAVREYYVATGLNQILPGGMAGDAFRAYRNRAEGTGGWKRPARAVLLERLSGQVAFFALTGCGLLAWPVVFAGHLPNGFIEIVLVFALLAASLFIAALVWKSKLLPRFDGLKPDLAQAYWNDGALAIQTGLSVLIVLSYVVTFMIASDAVGAQLPLIAAATVIPLCLMTMLIPAGIGGWGTRELAAAALWPVFGFTAAQGVSASLLYGAVSLAAAALPGLLAIVYSILRGRISIA